MQRTMQDKSWPTGRRRLHAQDRDRQAECLRCTMEGARLSTQGMEIAQRRQPLLLSRFIRNCGRRAAPGRTAPFRAEWATCLHGAPTPKSLPDPLAGVAPVDPEPLEQHRRRCRSWPIGVPAQLFGPTVSTVWVAVLPGRTAPRCGPVRTGTRTSSPWVAALPQVAWTRTSRRRQAGAGQPVHEQGVDAPGRGTSPHCIRVGIVVRLGDGGPEARIERVRGHARPSADDIGRVAVDRLLDRSAVAARARTWPRTGRPTRRWRTRTTVRRTVWARGFLLVGGRVRPGDVVAATVVPAGRLTNRHEALNPLLGALR